MPTPYQIKLPKPSYWQDFQKMTCDLYKELWNNKNVREFGSEGQRQNGVDVFGFVSDSKNIEGIQCKCVRKLTEEDVEQEYEKSLNFHPELSKFTIATTTDPDTNIQRKAAEITKSGKYPCEVIFWYDFCQYLANYIDLIRKHYSEFIIAITESDSPGKLIKLNININHYELIISYINPSDRHYGGSILVSDLLSRKCTTYGLDDDWTRLEGVVGITRCDAFLISKWLNSFEKIEDIFGLDKTIIAYELSEQDRREAEENGLHIMKRQRTGVKS